MPWFFVYLVSLSIVFTAVDSKEPFVIDRAAQDSPLDKDTLSGKGQLLQNKSEDGAATSKGKPKEDLLYVKGIHVPDCARGCMDQLFRTFEVAFRSGNNYERFSNVCHRFNETIYCLEKLNHCSSFELFHTVTSGMKYMCIEQIEAFSAVIDCVDAHAAEIKDSCVKSCNAEGIITGWAVYAALRGTTLVTPQIGRVPSQVNVGFFRKMAGEGCSVMECYLGCLRNKYNSKCHGVAGSLLSEVLVRPIAEGHNSLIITPWSNIVKFALPDECGVFTSPGGLDHYRIDPKLDEDLKRTYASAGKSRSFKYMVNGTVMTTPMPNAWSKPKPSTETQRSPLEDDGFDRDSLWRSALSGKKRRTRSSKPDPLDSVPKSVWNKLLLGLRDDVLYFL